MLLLLLSAVWALSGLCSFDTITQQAASEAGVVVLSGDRSQAPTKAASQSTARTFHTRMVLPATAVGRQGCSFVVTAGGKHDLCMVLLCYLLSGVWAVLLSTKKKIAVRAYENNFRPHAETRENALIRSCRGKKTWSACHALQSARIAPRPRPTYPDGLPVSTSVACCLKVLIRRDMLENGRKLTNITIHIHEPCLVLFYRKPEVFRRTLGCQAFCTVQAGSSINPQIPSESNVHAVFLRDKTLKICTRV